MMAPHRPETAHTRGISSPRQGLVRKLRACAPGYALCQQPLHLLGQPVAERGALVLTRLAQPIGVRQHLFESGAGCSGNDPDRFTSPAGLRAFAGTAPVTRASGRSHYVKARKIRNKRLADACHLSVAAHIVAGPARPAPPHRVTRDPQPPHDRLDRQALSTMQPADLRPVLQ